MYTIAAKPHLCVWMCSLGGYNSDSVAAADFLQ